MSGRCDRRTLLGAGVSALGALGTCRRSAGDPELRRAAEKAMRRGVEFFHTQVGVKGGYVWRYSEDLSRREGESRVGPTTAWVQPPGTPTVGTAFLMAYQATGDLYYLEAAKATGQALAEGQLHSGGWDYRIEFGPDRNQYAYRAATSRTGKNVTTYDDDTTQAALRFLMRLDATLKRSDDRIHRVTRHGLDALLKAQYTNGAWPQRYETFPQPVPVRPAAYPDAWPRNYPGADYRDFYTFNDRNIDHLIETLLLAWDTYRTPEYRKAVEKAGDFILLARMPDPQPAWAQQYNRDMHPAWARKFEPPSVTGGESQGLLRTLIHLTRELGDAKYLEPIPRALEYLRRSRLPDGRLARFYELRTNKPLYFTRKYVLTYSDTDLPTHYSFKVSDSTDTIARDYERLKQQPPRTGGRKGPPPLLKASRPDPRLEAEVRKVIAAQDERGRWVEEGRLKYHGADDPTRRIIDSATFARNVETLSRFLAAG